MPRTIVLVASAAVAAGCTSSSPATLPTTPAPCAGAANEAVAVARQDQWTFAVQSSPGHVLVGLATTWTAKQVVDRTADVHLEAIVFDYPYNQGTTNTSFREVDAPRTVDDLLVSLGRERGLPPIPVVDEDVRRSRERFAAGDVPFTGLRLRDTPEAVARFVRTHRCEVHSLLQGKAVQGPLTGPGTKPTAS